MTTPDPVVTGMAAADALHYLTGAGLSSEYASHVIEHMQASGAPLVDAEHSMNIEGLRAWSNQLQHTYPGDPYAASPDRFAVIPAANHWARALATPGPAAPTSHLQRMEYLRVGLALNRVASEREWLTDMRREHSAAFVEIGRQGAEDRLSVLPWSSPETLAERLTDALVWAEQSELAGQRLGVLVDYYANNAGLQVDPSALTVTVDPDFDAAGVQQFREAATQYGRERTAHQMCAVIDLPEQVRTALAPDLPGGLTPANAPEFLAGTTARREHLAAVLAEHADQTPGTSPVEFVVGYLNGQTQDVDLLAAPRLVDPADDLRGRMPALLEEFAYRVEHADGLRADYEEEGTTPAYEASSLDAAIEEVAQVGARIGTEIGVLSPGEQHLVREAGKAITGGALIDTDLWPDHVDRDRLVRDLRAFGQAARRLASEADQFAEDPQRSGETATAWLNSMQSKRAQLETAFQGKGLHPLEIAHLRATVDDIDTGRRDDKNLPDLLLLDERHKHDLDMVRRSARAESLAAQTYRDGARLLTDAGVDLGGPRTPTAVRLALEATADRIETVAHGGGSPKHLSALSRDVQRLGRSTGATGVDVEVWQSVKPVIEASVGHAVNHGRASGLREQLWRQRMRGAAREPSVSGRAGSESTRQAIAASCATPPERACAKPPGPATAATGAGTPKNWLRLAHPELER